MTSLTKDTKIFVEITTKGNILLSGSVDVCHDETPVTTPEILLQRCLNHAVVGAVYSTTALTENESLYKNEPKTIDKDATVNCLGTNQLGLRCLRVSLPELCDISLRPQLPAPRTHKEILREYVGYKVPIYVPFILALIWIATFKPDPDEVCFAHVGCFSLEAPWTARPIIFNFVPQSPAAINTTFRIYSRDKLEGTEISGRNKTPDVSAFEWENKGLIIIVHGFTDNADTWIKTLSYALLKKEDVNVVAVDWHCGADMYYPQVVANTRVVAAEIAMFLEYLKTTKGEKLRYVHLIGHSLGSHIAGYVGKRFPGVFKITALDPAAPLFDSAPQEIRLDKTDASEVEVIHSNIAPFGLGLKEPIGTVDIYLNNGQDQKGCKPMIEAILGPMDSITRMKDIIACSHRRAYEVYEEAVLSEFPLNAHLCSSWEELQSGSCLSYCQVENNCFSLATTNSVQKDRNRIYYMMTTEKRPFCLNFVKVRGHICEHQIEIQNVQLYVGFSELDNPMFEGTVTKLQPLNEWIPLSCHFELPLKLNIQFDTVDIIQAPICISNLSVELFNVTSGNLQRSFVNYTEVIRGECSVVVF